MNDPKTSIRPANWIGQALERREDAALLTGAGRYADDLGVRPGTLYAAFVRSPHAHARIKSIDVARALDLPGVRTVLVGADVRDWARPFVVGVKQPMEHWCIAQRSHGAPPARTNLAGPKPTTPETDFKGRITQASVNWTPAVASPSRANKGRCSVSAMPQ